MDSGDGDTVELAATLGLVLHGVSHAAKNLDVLEVRLPLVEELVGRSDAAIAAADTRCAVEDVAGEHIRVK